MIFEFGPGVFFNWPLHYDITSNQNQIY